VTKSLAEQIWGDRAEEVRAGVAAFVERKEREGRERRSPQGRFRAKWGPQPRTVVTPGRARRGAAATPPFRLGGGRGPRIAGRGNRSTAPSRPGSSFATLARTAVA
jgi:hypothetical protein